MKLDAHTDLSTLSNVVRGLAIDAVETAGHGHPGAAMGMSDIATVLYANYLKFDAQDPKWHDRDRVILSNGHASILLYSLLFLTGVPGLGLEDLKSFRKGGSLTPGHPEVSHTPGVETTTGPLGQGLGMAIGFALAEQRLRDEFGAEICDHRTWVFAGDGCLMEGVGQEACSLAGHLSLGRLNLLYDMNSITIDGSTDLAFTEDTAAKFLALGWHVIKANGHDHADIDRALGEARAETTRPSIVLFKTIIGYGAPTKSDSSGIHGSRLGLEEAAAAKAALGLPEDAFGIDERHLNIWRKFGLRGSVAREAWQQRVSDLGGDTKKEYYRRMESTLPVDLKTTVTAKKTQWVAEAPKVATRKASQMALEVLTQAMPEMIGGSADLTGSNLTKTKATNFAFTSDKSGRYINYGVREFAMGAAMNGLALHGGFLPYGGTFLVFSDYMRNAIRLAALMGTRVLYVMTHDSIGLGEDGPTHQPVEHLASLRAMPGLHVFRPADVIETMEAFEVALTQPPAPSLFALSRQSVRQVRLTATTENMTAKGGYVLVESNGKRNLTLIATGTEVSLAVDAAVELEKQGVRVAVVSLPCWSLFDAQPESYRERILGSAPRLAIEAASPFGWTRYVAKEEHVIAVREFGASASAEELYARSGLTTNNIVERSRVLLEMSEISAVESTSEQSGAGAS
ncbi:transketolase [Labrenzia sp. DG1229]|uniref:transketolase n=1 Tax=Labrenzia sp. DG1229 TaxID=681847 RepID=UPI00068F6C95|nr:transketolase [Labrenzia sp. DG1229]